MADLTASVAAALSAAIERAGRESQTEQALVLEVERALDPVLQQLGIPRNPEYEKTLIQGRADAVYGSVIIEYESRGSSLA